MHAQAPPAATAAPSQRHYGMDWLRIAAFGLLILYHIGMVFAPWKWVIHTSATYPALIAPMAIVTPWRLPLLFAVSGFASAKLVARAGSAGRFARVRAQRLLVPLAFGMAVLVPIEMWVLVARNGYPHGLLHFWAEDYWRVGRFWGRDFPSWEHLWFVAYLASYTMLLAATLAWAGPATARRARHFAAWLGRGRRLVWAPVAALAATKLVLLFLVAEHQGLFTDWAGHALYGPMFAFGFALGRLPALEQAIARNWPPALALAAGAGALVVATEMLWPGEAVPPHAVMALDRAARVAMGWSAVLVLFHGAERLWNRDHPWRRTLAEAVFPFYLFHHPAIVVLAWATLPLALPPGAEFAILAGGTLVVCTAVYLLGREVGWIRPFIGLGPMRRGRSLPADAGTAAIRASIGTRSA